MIKIPFDIKYRPQIESGEYKVETRDGRRVRIICWDAIGPSPIIGLFLTDDGGETTTQNRPDGRWCDDLSYESDYDLFIVTPKEEMTEFEIALENFVMNADASEQTFHENVKQHAVELIDLARKELIKEGTSKNEMGTMLYDAGFEDGKAEALKDLPRWNESRGVYSDGWIYEGFLYYKNHSIQLSSLEKLPGFNE